MERPFPGLLRAVRPIRVAALHDVRVELRRIERSRDAVVEQRRPEEKPVLAVDHLLHLRFRRAHVYGPFDLPFDERRIQRLAAVVRCPDLADLPDARLLVHLDFGDVRRERVRGRHADGAAAVVATELLRSVSAGGRERRSLGRLGELTRLGETHRTLRRGGGAELEPHVRGRAAHLRGDGGAQLVGELLARLARGQAHHESDAARVRAEIHRGQISVSGDDGYVARIAADLFRADLAEQRVHALSDVARAAVHGHAARAVQLEQHSALRHVVRVDGIRGAADVHRARHAQPAPASQLSVALFPARRQLDDVEALEEPVRGDLLPVDRLDALPDEVAPPYLDRI